MSEPLPATAPPAAIPYVYPLDALYARAGLPFPQIEKLTPEEMPEPYRTLLAHSNDMTPTLERFHAHSIHLKILHREQRGDNYFRQVVLALDGNDTPVEFGANKLSLLLFPPRARQMILEERLPLGTILKQCDIAHGTVAKAYFQVIADQLISSVLGVTSGAVLYGRKATINDSQKRPLSEVVEILPLAQ
jgi:hypothetical protein